MTRIAFILGFAAIITFFAMGVVENTTDNIQSYHNAIEEVVQ